MGLTTEQMQGFTRWTNLSETTFVLPPTTWAPTTGYGSSRPVASCRSPGTRRSAPVTRGCPPAARRGGRWRSVQECGAGLVAIRRRPGLASPPRHSSDPGRWMRSSSRRSPGARVDTRTEIVDAHWADNGPGWVAVLLADADAVLALEPASPTSTSAWSADIRRGPSAASRSGRSSPERRARRGSGHRQPERVGRAVAAALRPVPPRLTSPARAPPSAAPAGSTSLTTPTAPSGSVARTVTCVTGEVDL